MARQRRPATEPFRPLRRKSKEVLALILALVLAGVSVSAQTTTKILCSATNVTLLFPSSTLVEGDSMQAMVVLYRARSAATGRFVKASSCLVWWKSLDTVHVTVDSAGWVKARRAGYAQSKIVVSLKPL